MDTLGISSMACVLGLDALVFGVVVAPSREAVVDGVDRWQPDATVSRQKTAHTLYQVMESS
jgi:hypothetical protein